MTVARHSRTFPARRDALPQVDAFLGEVCAAAGLGRETCLRLTLLVEELFTNTVVHGHGADSEAPVRLECEVSPGRVALTYEDSGPLGAGDGPAGGVPPGRRPEPHLARHFHDRLTPARPSPGRA